MGEENDIELIRKVYKKIVDEIEKLENDIKRMSDEIKELEITETKAQSMVENIQEGLQGIESRKGYEKLYEELNKLVQQKQEKIKECKSKISKLKNKIEKLKKEKDKLNESRLSFWKIIGENDGKPSLPVSEEELKKDKMSYGQWG
ncbi:MAG: hypothetical protein J7K61_04175 [Thermoplasmata archaeon]|nr:hypothetical protein [Thermoplasmata archaeon]